MKKFAFLFPGQGDQYPGMGKDFYESFAVVRETFEEAEELLGFHLKPIIFDGEAEQLRETKNSQLAIYVVSIALLRVVQELFPALTPYVCAGLSLGEYSAVTAAGHIPFETCLPLVKARAFYMHDACELQKGMMAAVVGLSGTEVEEVVAKVRMPEDLWVANFNSPEQTVISGTEKGIEKGMAAMQDAGAKRVIKLNVHGAFHSGLMKEAQKRLAPAIEATMIQPSESYLIMNATGDYANESEEIRQNLIDQVTHPVRWTESILAMEETPVDCYFKFGCGKTLVGLNKRIGAKAPIVNIEKIHDLDRLETTAKDAGIR